MFVAWEQGRHREHIERRRRHLVGPVARSQSQVPGLRGPPTLTCVLEPFSCGSSQEPPKMVTRIFWSLKQMNL